jgi:hypothetical protein
MSVTTVSQASAMAAPLVRIVYFVELQFSSATVYLSTLNQPVTWGGNTWQGLGSLSTISQVSESDSLTTSPVNFSLNVAQAEWLALAVGAVETYRGLPAIMYFCPLDTSFQLIDTPVKCWTGVMDMMSIDANGAEGTITLKCETSAFGLKRASSFRMNAAQQRSIYPTDSGFDYVNDLINNPAVWLSKLFQSV